MTSSAEFTQKIFKRPDAIMQVQAVSELLLNEKKRRLEFYEWVTEDVKAEFILGQVVIQSPVRKAHWQVSDFLSSLLSFYVRIKKFGIIGTEKVMIALTRNDFEPDLVFFSKAKSEKFTEDQVLFPAPDFVVEILSKSTTANDRGIKKTDYAMHGIREYWIIDPTKQRIEQYLLPASGDEYFPAKIHQSLDTISSVVITGFSIPVAAIFDDKANLAAMENLFPKKK